MSYGTSSEGSIFSDEFMSIKIKLIGIFWKYAQLYNLPFAPWRAREQLWWQNFAAEIRAAKQILNQGEIRNTKRERSRCCHLLYAEKVAISIFASTLSLPQSISQCVLKLIQM